MYDRMYKVEANGFGIFTIVLGFLYGIVSMVIDLIEKFNM